MTIKKIFNKFNLNKNTLIKSNSKNNKVNFDIYLENYITTKHIKYNLSHDWVKKDWRFYDYFYKKERIVIEIDIIINKIINLFSKSNKFPNIINNNTNIEEFEIINFRQNIKKFKNFSWNISKHSMRIFDIYETINKKTNSKHTFMFSAYIENHERALIWANKKNKNITNIKMYWRDQHNESYTTDILKKEILSNKKIVDSSKLILVCIEYIH